MRDWGFFLLYVVTTVAAFLAVRAYSRRVRAGPRDTPAPEPYALAYLAGDEYLLMYAGIAALRMAGAISANTHGELEADGPLPEDTTEYERALYDVISDGTEHHDFMGGEPRLRPAHYSLRASLLRDGWLVPARTIAGIRRAGALIGLLAALGVVLGVWRMQDIHRNEWVSLLFIYFAFVPLVGAAYLRRPSSRTFAVEPMLEAERARWAHLGPGAVGGWPARRLDVVRSVALFGAGLIWTADTTFAFQADLPDRPPWAPVPTIDRGWDGAAGGTDAA
jgi:uncharacterized protein (TIGR04222 family)